MNCVVCIAGREAVPVRAIPFVTGWQSFTPDAVAEGLAHRLESGKLEGLTAYHIAGDGSISAMLPKEWDGPARALDALSAKLGEMSGDSYPAWREQSIPELPSHCFVWRDEFEKNVTDWWQTLHLLGERPGDKELNFTPRIPQSLEDAVFEGMPMGKAEPDADVEAARIEAALHSEELTKARQRQGATHTTPTARPPRASARTRHDDMTIEIDDVIVSLERRGECVTPAKVMSLLKERAGRADSCISGCAPDGVLWTRSTTGANEKLTMGALTKRLRRRANATQEGC